jgi:hypothetical protein
MDLSLLTRDERTRIKLEMMGLGAGNQVARYCFSTTQRAKASELKTNSNVKLTMIEASEEEQNSKYTPENGTSQNSIGQEQEEVDIEQVISAMIEDLERTNDLIKKRANFARNFVRSQLETPQVATKRKQQDVSAMVRNAALLKRSKEVKSKAAKAKSSQNDDLKLPW